MRINIEAVDKAEAICLLYNTVKIDRRSEMAYAEADRLLRFCKDPFGRVPEYGGVHLFFPVTGDIFNTHRFDAKYGEGKALEILAPLGAFEKGKRKHGGQ